MEKEINQNGKNNLSNSSSPSYTEMNELIDQFNENLSFSESSNKVNPGSDSTFQSDKNTPVSSPLFSHGDSSHTRSFSVNFSTRGIFDPHSRSFADLNSVAIGVAGENEQSDSDEKFTPKYSSEELSDRNGSGSYGNLSPDREITENWNENSSENTNSPIHSDPFDPLESQQIEEEQEQEEDENTKRIKDWISKIEINSIDMIVQETGESSAWPAGPVSPVSSRTGQTGQVDPKASVSIPMGYNYISAMNPVTASAHLSSLGLIAVPILTAFGGLRELSLSKNNILRITAGSLPKGLHVLDLSKNYISAIEGLKELTRLRVLDLSHNRISRIGHGLSACSSIKELYLSSNKISEIEGLHRLLKLKTLDLRSNKLSTAKGLEQLAANYGSLEAISLDGNPAQRYVGDEHLKKYLLTLLPGLVCYNRHSAKLRCGKDRIGAREKGSRNGRNGGNGNGRNGKGRNGRNEGMSGKGRNGNLVEGRRGSGSNPLRRVYSDGAMGVGA